MFLPLCIVLFLLYNNSLLIASWNDDGTADLPCPSSSPSSSSSARPQQMANANDQKETNAQQNETAAQQTTAGADKPALKSKSAKFAEELRVKPVVQRSMSAMDVQAKARMSPKDSGSPIGTEQDYIGTLKMDGLAPIVLRKARPSDVDEIITFAQPAYTRDPLRADLVAGSNLSDVKKTEYNQCRSMLLDLFDGTRVVLVGETRDRAGRKRLISCFQMYKQSETSAYFGMFAVHPFFQKTGLGKRLLSIAERYAHVVWRSDELYLDVGGTLNELRMGMGRLQRYYARRGFRSTGIRRPFRGAVARFITVDRNDLWIEQMVKDIRGEMDDYYAANNNNNTDQQQRRMGRVNSRGRLTKEATDETMAAKRESNGDEDKKNGTKEEEDRKKRLQVEEEAFRQTLLDMESLLLEKIRL